MNDRRTVRLARLRKPWRRLLLRLLPRLLLFRLLPLAAAHAAEVRLPRLTVVTDAHATAPELQAARMLVEEANARTGLHWRLATDVPSSPSGPPGFSEETTCSQNSPSTTAIEPSGSVDAPAACVYLALHGQMRGLLPPSVWLRWRTVEPGATGQPSISHPEGFSLVTLRSGARPDIARIDIVIAGNDSRGLLFGVGCLLRHLQMAPGAAVLPASLRLRDAPEFAVRSHQIGYRFKNNTYDAWTLPMFEQQLRDLAVFGISGLQIVAPASDDRATSPLYPAPALPTIVGLSAMLARYGLDCDLYYPETEPDYGKPAAVEAELTRFTALVRAMPHINALYVPGGDPGQAPPELLLPLLAREAAILRSLHPGATVWVSAQGYDRARFRSFYSYLRTRRPTWLTGVFFGPQSRDSFRTQRAHIPRRYAMLFYPDIGHTMHAEFPVPRWDPVFAMTQGREPIDPRPVDETHIFRHFAALHSGFVTYSEGVNDDVNKFLWTRLGWHQRADPHETLREYARYFLGPHFGNAPTAPEPAAFADALFDLERDWRGPLATNRQIPRTLAELTHLGSVATPGQQNNWRYESALYRATYDAWLQRRLRAETADESRAMTTLAHASTSGSLAAMQSAEAELLPADAKLLPAASADDPAAPLRAQLFLLAGRLWEHVRLQLSVRLYGASAIERGANLDRVDVPLNDRVWLARRFTDIRTLPTEAARLAALERIVHYDDPEPGTLHDDLGQPGHEPHLVRGIGFARDPELYRTAIDGVADATTQDGWRLSELSYAETLYETPLQVRYTGLDPAARYTLRVTYAGEAYALPITLDASSGDGTRFQIHAPRQRTSNPETVEFPIPAAASRHGTLTLTWMRPDGMGGSGRGRQVAETWLIPHENIAGSAPAVHKSAQNASYLRLSERATPARCTPRGPRR